MSVLVAMVANSAVVIGGDTAIYSDQVLIGHSDKWTVTSNCALGFVGDYAIGQATASSKLLDHTPTCRTLVGRMKKRLQSIGLPPMPQDENQRPTWDCEWLYVRRGCIWHLDGMLSFSDCGDMAAIGEGGDIATGALLALKEFDLDSNEIIVAAVNAAIRVSAHCGGEAKVWTVNG